MLTSNPGQSLENDLSCNLSGTCNIHDNSPERLACLGFRFPRLPASGEVLGTPKADVTPPPPPQCFVSYVSSTVSLSQLGSVSLGSVN